jgi:micrococcal nuclease
MSDIPESLCKNDCPRFFPPLDEVRVLSVYDGDTLTVAGRINGQVYQFPVRLQGIDTPELRCKCKTRKGPWTLETRQKMCEQEHNLARFAKNALKNKVLRKVVKIKISNVREKYGRLLAELFLDGQNINHWMVEQGLAKKYEGRAKSYFTHD